MSRRQGRGGSIFISATLGASCLGELGHLSFPRDLHWTSPHPHQYECILHDSFLKVLETRFFDKFLLLPPSYLPPPPPAPRPFTFLSLCQHLLSASALLRSICAHVSCPPSPLLPFLTFPFVLYHWQSRSHTGSQQGKNMKGTMTFF